MMDTCLCIFAKAPVCGQVKTRLLPVLNEEQACQLHQDLLQHCISQTQHTEWQSQLWSSDVSHSVIQAYAKQYQMSLHQQQGTDLGARMDSAMRKSLQKFNYVVIIGSDCPSIDAALIAQALKKLKAGFDVVLGPAADGGYVLIGFSSVAENVFTDIEWGSDQVLKTTRSHLQAAGISWSELAVQRDIDRPDDLTYLQQFYPDLFHSIGVLLSFPQSDHEPG